MKHVLLNLVFISCVFILFYTLDIVTINFSHKVKMIQPYHCRIHWQSFIISITSIIFIIIIIFLPGLQQTNMICQVKQCRKVCPSSKKDCSEWHVLQCRQIRNKLRGFCFSTWWYRCSYQAHRAESLANLPASCPGCVPGRWAAGGQACTRVGSEEWPGCRAWGIHNIWLRICHLQKKNRLCEI